MRELFLDADGWETMDDFFQAFFLVVGAPSWHGKNFNALRDSVGMGSINQIEVPFRLILKNFDRIRPSLKEFVNGFVATIDDLASEGVPVEIRVESSSYQVPTL